ncbi:MAG: hypothetical protein WC966_08545 [Bradymonadales bacterium]|jgi:hypothetical protein
MRKVTLILGIFFILCSTTVYAQADLEVFKKRMELAAEKTKAGDLKLALVDYLEIRATYTGPEIDYSLGRIYQRLHQCNEAQYYYSQLMVAYDLALEHPIYQRAVEGYDIIAACQNWGRVTIDCAGYTDEAWVEVDGEKIGRCWERAYSLPAGEHHFVLKDADGRVAEERIVLKDGSKETLRLELKKDVEEVIVERMTETIYREQDRFAPELYWGLMLGGTAVMGVGGVFAALAYKDMVDVQKYEDRQNAERAKKARDGVKLNKILMYTSLGVGGALAVSGITIAIINALSEKTIISESTTTFLSPVDGGLLMGFGMNF